VVVQPTISAWNAVTTAIPKAMNAAANAVASTWSNVMNGIRSVVNGVLSSIVGGINGVVGQINGLVNAYNNLPGSPNIPNVPTMRVPVFALGGYVKGPTLALIGEGGEGESVVPDSKRVGFAMNVLRGMTGAAAIPAFAKGGYIAGENPANRGWQSSIGTSAFAGATETRNGMTYTFDPFGTIRLQQAIASASQAKKNASGKGGLSETEKNQIIRSMGGEITPFGGFRMNAPKNAWFTNDSPKSTTSASRTVNVTTSINAQPVAPDMFLVNGDEVRRMALEVAQQAIGQNNAQQRQPSARRRAGVR
jgi:hypothetical protein